jgi:hypothetical protein
VNRYQRHLRTDNLQQFDEATAAINKFTGENGYAVSKRRSKVDKKGDLNKIYFQCNPWEDISVTGKGE